MITSTKNDRIRRVIELKKKARARAESGLFVVEGIRMAGELPAERVEELYLSEAFAGDRALPANLQSVPCEIVSDSVFQAMSDTQAPQGILALVRQYRYGIDDLLAGEEKPFIMILENLQDPGNLGTILRAGEGAGITGIFMSRDTVDLYNPKVIRSTMGSVFRVPFCYADSEEEFYAGIWALKRAGVRLFAAHLDGIRAYECEDYTGAVGFLIGNEGNGLTERAASCADEKILIPMAGKVESLNAAVAASVLMFETARQRRGAKQAAGVTGHAARER